MNPDTVQNPGLGSGSFLKWTDAEAFVDQVVADPQQAVVIFILDWCQFCRSACMLLDQLGVPYRALDLGKGAFLQDRLGTRIRAVLAERTGSTTVPQIFIGGIWVGGATELFAAYRNGKLAVLLSGSGIDIQGL